MAHLDSITRSLVLTRSRDVQRVANPTQQHMLLRLQTHRGTCWWDPTFGSTLHLLTQEKIGPAIERDVEDRARTALRPMTATRELLDLVMTAQRTATNRVELALRARDAGRRPITFSLWVAV